MSEPVQYVRILEFVRALAPEQAPVWAEHAVTNKVIDQIRGTEPKTAEVLQLVTREWSKVYAQNDGDNWCTPSPSDDETGDSDPVAVGNPGPGRLSNDRRGRGRLRRRRHRAVVSRI